MKYLFVLITATAISILIIPMMVRLAPRMGFIDIPDSRKIHADPIPRVGGWGIVIGALIALLTVLTLDRTTLSYVLGSIILFLFGILDDRKEMGHYHKFVGQFLAALTVVFFGDLYVDSFPFLNNDFVPYAAATTFTTLALVGMINAINHSDGLDGLAAGECLFSLGVISFLAYAERGQTTVLIALAVTGGIIGFLRYNTHPAKVFMGDSGSQFLGFTLGFLAINLTQRVDTALSPSVVLLLLGLPIADILMVLIKRIRNRMSWFRATRNHIHHRLIDLGFVHPESVIIIYSLQMFFVTTGVLLRHESDWKIVLLYLSVCTAIFGMLSLAERSGWNAHHQGILRYFSKAIVFMKRSRVLIVAPRRFLSTMIPLYLVGSSIIVFDVSLEVGVIASLVFTLMVIESQYPTRIRPSARRALLYITAALVVYTNHPPTWFLLGRSVETIFFLIVAVAIAIATKSSPGRRKSEFKVNATDYLVVLVLLAGLVITRGGIWESSATAFLVKMVIILYGCELLFAEERSERWNTFRLAALGAVMVLSVRGIF